jgi:acetyl esterase
MPVDPDIQPFIDDPELRADRPKLPMHQIDDHSIPGPAGDVPVRLYRPSAGPTGTVLLIHGGGWQGGSIRGYDFLARRLAADTGQAVVSLDYRLAPEHPFPAALHDSLAVARWVSDHPQQYGGKAGFGVAGDSAGGNIAAVLARIFRDEGRGMAAQLLLYPIVDSGGHYPSRDENASGYVIGTYEIKQSAEMYLAGQDMWTSPDFAPMHARDLAGIAPAVIGAAQYDPMRDDALEYARRLADAGVDVFVRSYEGMIHTFAARYSVSPRADAALTELLQEFRTGMLGPAV